MAELDASKTSPKFGGKKLINSMKKSFRSLRLPRRQHTTDDSLTRRRQSNGVVNTITRGASQDNRNYPGELTSFYHLAETGRCTNNYKLVRFD